MATEAVEALDAKNPEILITTDWSVLLDKAVPEATISMPDAKNFDQVYKVSGLLSGSECSRLVTAQEHKGFGFTNYPKHYRGNLRLMADDVNLADALASRILPIVPAEITDDENADYIWKPVGLNPRFRCSKYYPGDVFGAHCDTYFEKNSDEISMFTVNVYTSTIADGGETRFFHPSRKLRGPRQTAFVCAPIAGDAVIFMQPPGREYYHDGAAFSEGRKYLLRTDVMYRRIRKDATKLSAE